MEVCFSPATHFIATVEDLTDMLDYGSNDIEGMDGDAGEEEAQDPPFTGRWMATSSYDVYMWMHQRRTTAMTKKIQSRINLLRYSQSADVSGTALNQAVEMIAIPAQEKIILWMMPKTMKTPLSQLRNRTNGKMGE